MPPRVKRTSKAEEVAAGPYAGQASIRKAYEALGVEQFYARHGAQYTNPHESQIFNAVSQLFGAVPATAWLGFSELELSINNDSEEASDGAESDDDLSTVSSRNDHSVTDGCHTGAPAPFTTSGPAFSSIASTIIPHVTSGLQPPVPLRVLDLACGSGEVTAALHSWNQRNRLLAPTTLPRTSPSATQTCPSAAAAASTGVHQLAITSSCKFAAKPSPTASNQGPPALPHSITPQHALATQQPSAHPQPLPQPQPSRSSIRSRRAGTSSTPSAPLPYDLYVTACDPYTGPAYLQRTGTQAQSWSFEDIAAGCLLDWQHEPEPPLPVLFNNPPLQQQQQQHLPDAAAPKPHSASNRGLARPDNSNRSSLPAPAPGSQSAVPATSSTSGHDPHRPTFDLILCSFALHLCPPSHLYTTLTALSLAARWLVVLAPHKRPVVTEAAGWVLVATWRVERTHVRLYRSLRSSGA